MSQPNMEICTKANHGQRTGDPTANINSTTNVAGKRFHFIGAGGVGMSGLAKILLKNKAVVTGSDQTPSSVIDRLCGIAAGYGHSLGLKACQYKLIGDNNNDCRVDFRDFALMAKNWLIDCYQTLEDPNCVPKGP